MQQRPDDISRLEAYGTLLMALVQVLILGMDGVDVVKSIEEFVKGTALLAGMLSCGIVKVDVQS